MKKFLILLLTLTLILGVFVSCNSNLPIDDETSEVTKQETTESSQTNQTENAETNDVLTDIDETLGFAIQVYSNMSDGLYGMDTSDTPIVSENIEKRYNDETATPKFNVDFLNMSYEFEYEYSEDCATSNYLLHVYCLPNKATTKIFVNAQNNEIVEYRFLDFENNLITEQEYLTFIQNLINELYDSKYNLSEYEYSVYTAYREISENALSSTGCLGFKIMEPGIGLDYKGNEYSYDEELNSYYFTFRKPLENIDANTNEYIKVVCSNDDIWIQLFDFGYDENTFKQVIPRLSELDIQLENYFKEMIKSGYECTDISVTDHELFIKDGIPHVRSIVSMKVKDKDLLGYVENLIEVITKLVPKTIG